MPQYSTSKLLRCKKLECQKKAPLFRLEPVYVIALADSTNPHNRAVESERRLRCVYCNAFVDFKEDIINLPYMFKNSDEGATL